MDLQLIIDDFFKYAVKRRIEIYNEFALQFELAIFLRARLEKDTIVQLERNISFLNLKKENFVKKEMDILVFRNPQDLKQVGVVELKAIINQNIARPINIFNWITDLLFLEQLKSVGIGQCVSLLLTDNENLISSKTRTKSNTLLRQLPDFRARRIDGTYDTHSSNNKNCKSITLENKYEFEWKNYLGAQKYFSIAL